MTHFLLYLGALLAPSRKPHLGHIRRSAPKKQQLHAKELSISTLDRL
jgi:hypothetical protein